MASDKKLYTIDDLIEKASSYITKEEELQKIRDVFEFCKEKHEGQYRQSGEPYYYHPLATAVILTTVYADCDTICAGLLHDVIEDTEVTKPELEELYGPTVANLVNGVTKISKIHFSTENEALIEYYKKIIVGMSEDVRVIIIKLADRLHNMRTLWVKTEDKQKKIAKETLDILAPIAHHLGIHKIKSELEDLSLRYLKPNVFYDIADKLNSTKLERDKVVNDMITSVSNLLKENNIEHEIKGRSKSIYSIYKKLEKGRKFSDIYDLLALRILVDNVQQCYSIIGMIHAKYKPIPKRFKDYIAMPKVNGYQSLHTTVFGIDGYLFEIQIRTHEMDEVAENGVASHWAYKEHKDLTQTGTSSTEAKLQFFKSIVELNEDKMSSEEFVNSVKNEILNNNIYVFTPKGDIFELPKGSTPIDFAYCIHTRVGETMVGAIVNDSIVPLDYELQDNDIVKINTNKNSPGPSKEWLNIVRSTRARNKIKTFFTKGEKERYIERGKAELEKELRKKKLGFNEFFNEENTEEIFKQAKVVDMNDLYLNIGNGKFSGAYVINLIYKKENILDKVVFKEIPTPKHIDGDVIVEGIDKIKVNLANCCNPVPGDEIVGYITKGNGISVHRRCCHNLAFLDNRVVTVAWNPEKSNNKFITSLFVHCNDYDKSLLEIMQKASTSGINIDSMHTTRKVDEVIYNIDIWVRDLEHLNNFIRDLENMSYIEKVVRIIK